MTGPLPLQESIHWTGLWWRLEAPSDQIAGTLIFDPQLGASLTLIGAFESRDDPFAALAAIQATLPEETIFGFSETGKSISFLGAVRTDERTHVPGMVVETWKGSYVVVGAHLPSFQTEAFQQSKIGFLGLAEWLDRSPFGIEISNSAPTMKLTCSPPAEVDLGRIGDLGLQVRAETTIVNQSDRLHFMSLRARSAVVLKTDQAKSLSWHLKQAALVNRLAALCMGQHLPFTFVRLEEFDNTALASEFPRAQTVEVLFRTPGGANILQKITEPPIYTTTDLLGDNPSALDRWFSIESRLKPTIDLLLTYLENDEFPVEVSFLLMAQAIEVFHRNTAQGTIMNEVDFKKIHQTIVGSIPKTTPKEMFDKIKMIVGFANEPSLKDGILALIESMKLNFGKDPFGFSKITIDAAAHSRNYYTHYTPKTAKKALHGIDLYFLTKRFVPLIFALLLIELNIPPHAVNRQLAKRRDLNRWAQP